MYRGTFRPNLRLARCPFCTCPKVGYFSMVSFGKSKFLLIIDDLDDLKNDFIAIFECIMVTDTSKKCSQIWKKCVL